MSKPRTEGVRAPNQRAARFGDRVRVRYQATLDDGRLLGSTPDASTYAFDLGTGKIRGAFDRAVEGLHVGESRTIRLDAAEAFGRRDASLVVRVAISRVPPGLRIGDSLDLDARSVVVTALDTGSITVDANHPLAGEALTFEVTLVTVDAAAGDASA